MLWEDQREGQKIRREQVAETGLPWEQPEYLGYGLTLGLGLGLGKEKRLTQAQFSEAAQRTQAQAHSVPAALLNYWPQPQWQPSRPTPGAPSSTR